MPKVQKLQRKWDEIVKLWQSFFMLQKKKKRKEILIYKLSLYNLR